MIIHIKAQEITNEGILVLLKAIKELEKYDYHYDGYEDFEIKVGEEGEM